MSKIARSGVSPLNPAIERLVRHKWLIAGTGCGTLLCMATALALVHDGSADNPEQRPVIEQLSTIGVTLGSNDSAPFLREEQIRRSDTLSSLITRLGVSDQRALSFLTRDASMAAIARQLRPGKTVSAETTASGELVTCSSL